MRPPPGYYSDDPDYVAPPKPKRAKRGHGELGIQVAIVRFLRLQLPGCVLHASPNGALLAGVKQDRTIAMAKLKAAGMLVGWPDLEVVWKGNHWFFEVKQPGGVVSQAQIDVGAMLQKNGARWAVVRSISDVQDCIREWQGDL